MSPPLHDAHNHLHDARFAPHLPGILARLDAIGLAGAVVNGTCEADWPGVTALAARDPRLLPSFGLHPWRVPARSPDWRGRLLACLEAHPGRVAIGEIGLDRWIPDHDLADQRAVFLEQLRLAAERNLPVTIHCLQAWGALAEVLHETPVPERGFLIHAYGGPAELVGPFARRGAYFSFNGSMLHERKAARRELFRTLPLERLLIETDAPDMPPPVERMRHPLPPAADGALLTHPAEIETVFHALAGLRGMPPDELADRLAENFRRLFGACGRP